MSLEKKNNGWMMLLFCNPHSNLLFPSAGSEAVKLPLAPPDTHCVVPKHCQHLLICARRVKDAVCCMNCILNMTAGATKRESAKIRNIC